MPAPAPQLRPPSRGAAVAWVLAALLAALALVPLTTAWTEAQDLGHGWAVPLLAGYLWWERWGERPSGLARERLSARWWLAAVVIAVVAFASRVVLTPFPLWPAALAAYLFVIAAVALGGAWLAAGGAGVRWLGGPLIVVLGALPWPSLLELKIVGPMRGLLASAAAEVCYASGVSALAAGTTLRLAHTWVGVDETCGGMRSLQATVMAALFLGEWLRLTWPRRVGLVGVGMAAAVFGNFLRILLLVWRASAGGEPALQAAHDLAGWIALAVSLGLTGGVAWWWRSAAAPTPARVTVTAPDGRAAFPRAALVWVGMLVLALGVVEVGTRAWYVRGERQQAAVAKWSVSFPDRRAEFRSVPLGRSAREMLRPDFFASGEWQDDQQRRIGAYYVEWRRGQAAHSIPFMHNPTICLPMSGCELVRPIGTVAVRWAGGEIPFHAYLFRRTGEIFAVAFVIWDPSRGRPLENDSVTWRSWMTARFQHVVEARADQPAQLLAVAVWGEKPEEHLSDNIGALIGAK